MSIKNNANLMHDGTERDYSKPSRMKNGYRYYLTQAEIDERDSERQADSLKKLAELPKKLRRWFENQRVTVDGVDLYPNQDNVRTVASLIQYLETADAGTIIAYKAENGFFDLNLEGIQSIYVVLLGIQQKVFSTEAILTHDINLENIQDIQSVKDKFNGLMKMYFISLQDEGVIHSVYKKV